ncbi:MAG: TonB-dependent receptor [Opitutae bacterium]|nr:TonB-dependent receptor [Opitutae bacterium]
MSSSWILRRPAHLSLLLLFGVSSAPAMRADPVQTDRAPAVPVAGVQLSPLVVTATRTAADPALVPCAVSVVTSADLMRQAPRTTPEALRELPSLMLQKTAHGQGSPYLRGFTGFRTLMLVDGIRLNNSTFRDGPNQYWSTVDALALDRLEVVRGPSSVLHGSDAIGGTVQALSPGQRALAAGETWDFRTFYRHATAEDSHIARLAAGGPCTGALSAHAGVSWKKFGDLRAGGATATLRQTGYAERDWDAALAYALTPNTRLLYGHQTVNLDEAWRTHSTVFGTSWAGTTVGTDLRRLFDQGRQLDYLQYHATAQSGAVKAVHLSLSLQRQDECEDRVRANLTRQVQTVAVRTLGLTAQGESASALGRWVYGVDYYRDWVDSAYRGYDAAGLLTTVRAQGPVADDATYDLAGAYFENQLPLAGRRLRLHLGGRYTRAQVDAAKIRDPLSGATFALTDSWDNVVGNARLLCQLDPAGQRTLFVGAAQGFRAPNLSDLTRWDADWGQEIPSPGVQPERFLSLEIGARLRTERLRAEAVIFRTLIDRMIVRVPTGALAGGIPIVTKLNSGDGYAQGIELSGNATLTRDWTLWGNYTWLDGEVESPATVGGPLRAEPLSRLMPVTVNAGLRWQSTRHGVWAECASTIAARQDRLAANDRLDTQRIPPGGTPGYTVLHVRAGWNPGRHTTITIALENLTNRDYRIHGSGLNEPGRNLLVTLAGRF